MIERIKAMWLSYPKVIISLIVCLLVMFGISFYVINQQGKEVNIKNDDFLVSSKKVTSQGDQAQMIAQHKAKKYNNQEQLIYVDIKGAIKKPGVYKIPKNYRLETLIVEAQGPIKEADLNQVNLAKVLSDQMVIYIPKKHEKIPAQFKNSTVLNEAAVTNLNSQEDQATSNNMINLNTAKQEDLLTLTGVGPSKAAAILQYREEHGQFKQIDELKEVSGIGEKTFEKIKDMLSV